MQDTNSKSAASFIINQLHPEKTSPLPSKTTTAFAGQTDQSQTRQPETGLSSVPPVEHKMQGNGQPQDQQVTTQEQAKLFPGQNPQQTQNKIENNSEPQAHLQNQEQKETDQMQPSNSESYHCTPRSSPDDDFTEVYRTGNFGTHFGRVNVKRGKRWTMVHGILSCAMFVFTLAATIMMKSFTNEVIRSMLFAFSWMAAVGDCLTAIAAWFLIWRLSTLRNPLTMLIVLRFAAAFNIVFNVFFFMVGLFGLLLQEKDFVSLTSAEVGVLKFLYFVITILMAIKVVTSYAFVFLWWGCPTCCHALGPYCVFDQGQPLAEGVDNSAGALRVVAVGHVAAAVGQEMNRH